MSRAFILLHHERRKLPRLMTLPPREIPIQDSADEKRVGPLVTTAGKVISWLSALLVIVVTVSGWLLSNRFETIVQSHFREFELRLVKEYALKTDALSKVEYELRHAELINSLKVLEGRLAEDERRINELSARQFEISRNKK